MLKPLSSLFVVAIPLCLALWSCGSDNPPPPPPPTAYDQENTTPIAVSLSDVLEAANVDFSTSTFTIVVYPAFGTIGDFNQDTGDFTYFPTSGTAVIDDFEWQVSDQYGVSNVAEYTIGVGEAAAIPGVRQPIASR